MIYYIMSVEPSPEYLLDSALYVFVQELARSPITDVDEMQDATGFLLDVINDQIQKVDNSDFSETGKLYRYVDIENFIKKAIRETRPFFREISTIANELTSSLKKNLQGPKDTIKSRKNTILLPERESTAQYVEDTRPAQGTRVEDTGAERTFENNTNVATGFGGLVSRIRNMITPRERIQSNAIIPEASSITPDEPKNDGIVVASTEPGNEDIAAFAYATPVQPTTEMRSGRFIRPGRTQVNNLITRDGGGGGGGGNTPPGNYLGGFIGGGLTLEE
jgi:hypothetical protein